jgi:hypothetical protein
MENIDLEEGKIRVGGKWLTEDEIRYAIKMKVSSDDYNVADLAVALQTLINEMRKSAILRVRVPKDVAQEFEDLSRKRGESMESTLRNILVEYITRKRELVRGLEEETVTYEDIGMKKPEKEFGEEMERGERFLGERVKEIDISIGNEDVDEDENVDELLDIDTSTKDSEIVEVEAEELSDIEAIDEDINEPEIEVLESEEDESEEDLGVEELGDIEDIDEDIIEPEIEDLEPEREETEEELEAELMPDIDSIDEKFEELGPKKLPKKKKAKKKKLVIRKKKLKRNG